MKGYLDISRAARAAGVSRREIRQRIADGDLASFEGRVGHDELSALYPRAATVPAGMLEHVAGLKEAALAKPPAADGPGDGEPLRDAYRRLSADLAHVRGVARDRLLLLKDLEARLGQLEVDVRPPQRVRALANWLRVRLRRDDVR